MEQSAPNSSSLARTVFICAAVVFGLLVTFGIGFFFGARWATRVDTGGVIASMQLSGIRLGLEMFYADTGCFPTPAEGLKVITQPVGQGPYIQPKEIIDPWGRPFLYQYSGVGVPTVTTLGADGVPGVTSGSADEDLSARPAIGPSAFPPAWRPLTTRSTSAPWDAQPALRPTAQRQQR